MEQGVEKTMLQTKSFAKVASAVALAIAMWFSPGTAQGQPLYDRIHVNLPYKITLGDKTLQPGDYTIQRLPDNGGGGRVLLFYTDDGMKFETSAMTIPVLDINTARDTKVILGHIGEDYYINKIWVQGKDYGYELPMPKSLRDRQSEQTESVVSAQNKPTAETPAVTTTQAEPTPPATPATPATPVETPAEPQTRPAETPVAQSTPPAQQPVEQQPTTPAATPENSADRSMPEPTPATPEMPATAANWMLMLLSGGALSGAGMMLRRKR